MDGGEDLNQETNLLILWRFDEGNGKQVEDLSNFEINAAIELKSERENDEIWNALDDGDPLELEDKWGKKCPAQFAINLYKDEIMVRASKKSWGVENVKQFTVEFWLKPRTKQGTIFDLCGLVCSLSDLFIKLSYKSKDVHLLEEKKEGMTIKSEFQEDDFGAANPNKSNDSKQMKENFWNHVAITFSTAEEKNLIIYLNCIEIFYGKTILPFDLFKESNLCLGRDVFIGEITEFRLWRNMLELSEIKENYRTPLEIVMEKKKKIKIVINKEKKKADQDLTKVIKKHFSLSPTFSITSKVSI